MLIKEYRISLPMSVEEYRIAQLYMIQKKSRDESHGTDSGVEIIENKPYTNGPGGSGQYTYKIYHIGSHLPSWFRAILPKSALRVEEEAWNAYPYTKTRYKCPFIEKFLLEVETKYHDDPGEDDGVFSLSKSEKSQRIVDYIDIVKDSLTGGDYRKEEDPRLYKSKKTCRGPLSEEWRKEYAQSYLTGHADGKEMMTAYKLCRVEFKYWGMQNKIERFIHDIALRKTMLRAHRQAWCWQDEYFGLTLDDIRALERETQLALAEKMAAANRAEGEELIDQAAANEDGNTAISSDRQPRQSKQDKPKSSVHFSESTISDSTSQDSCSADYMTRSESQESTASTVVNGSIGAVSSIPHQRYLQGFRERSSEEHWSSLEQLQEPSSDEEFFDAQEDVRQQSNFDMDHCGLFRSSSMDLISGLDDSTDTNSFITCAAGDEPQFDKRVEQFRQIYSVDSSINTLDTSPPPSASACSTQILFLVLHGGNVLDSSQETFSKRRDLTNLRATFDSVIQSHYQTAHSHVQFRLVACRNLCKEALSVLSSLSLYNSQSGSGSTDSSLMRNQNYIPLGAIALFATGCADYQEHVNAMVVSANQVYHDFLKSENGRGFSGQVCLLSDAVGSILAYDALTSSSSPFTRGGSRYGSHDSVESSAIGAEPATCSSSLLNSHAREISLSDPSLVPSTSAFSLSAPKRPERSKSEVVPPDTSEIYQSCKEELTAMVSATLSSRQSSRHNSGHLSASGENKEKDISRRTSSGSHYDSGMAKFDFDVSDFFMCGAPLGMVLAYRKLHRGDDAILLRPACHQVYNLFHSNDPTAVRLEPLLHEGFSYVAPVSVCRYSKFPLGDGEPVHVVETIQKHLKLFTSESREHKCSISENTRLLQRQNSLSSMTSTSSGLGENTVTSITGVTRNWWGVKRVDFVLYCPEALHSFPTNALPHLFHSSFWESTDVVAFILRQVLRQNEVVLEPGRDVAGSSVAQFKIKTPREKWLKRRTTIKVRNLQPNHRANDVVVLEDMPQILTAKFMYGSLDITSLSGEKVDVNVMKQPPAGDWTQLGTETTDSHGRFSYEVPQEDRLSQGGDHTSVDFYLAVLPPKTETVAFSIDGSFTASVSIMGKDPKVRAGAVDVVRQWQDLGYLILYVSARPDLQHRKVVAWLAQHNFPHGMVAFMDGLSKDPLKQKYNYIKSLQTEAKIELKAAYGSSKDITIYRELGLQSHQIFIVGKASKKQHGQAQILSDGYSAHLSQLMSPGFTRPAVGNARMFLRKSNFRLSTHEHSRDSKKSARRTISHPPGHVGSASEFISDGNPTKIVVQDFSSGSSGARGRDPSPRLQLTAHGRTTDI